MNYLFKYHLEKATEIQKEENNVVKMLKPLTATASIYICPMQLIVFLPSLEHSFTGQLTLALSYFELDTSTNELLFTEAIRQNKYD